MAQEMTGATVGKYRVEERVGRGGMGTVYRALDQTLHREVAIKVLNAELDDPEIAKRFRAEAITVAKLNHPGIATIYELFEHDGQWLMVMEFVRGETLERLIERSGPLPLERAVELTAQTLTALAHAHALGVVHRDLKLPNLMLTEAGNVKIMDFGIARVSGSDHLTSVGFTMGTPAYMAPEQVLGKDVDARTDLYAMGVVLFRLITAQLPFKGDTPFALANSHVHDMPTPIRVLRGGLPEWLEAVVARVLAKAPADRFQTAAQFRDALLQHHTGSTTARLFDSMAATSKTPTPAFPLPTPSASSSTAETMMASPALGVAQVPTPAIPDPPKAPAPKTSSKTLYIAAGVVVLLAIIGWLSRKTTEKAPPAAPVFAAPVTPAPAPPMAVPQSKPDVRPKPAAAPAASEPVVPTRAASADAQVAARTPARAVAPADDSLLVFGGAKLLTFDGRKGKDQEVILHFGSGQVSVLPKDGGAPLRTMPYKAILHASYAHTKDPLWDTSLPGLPEDADIPGFMRGARHWLMLQGKSGYMLVFLNDRNFQNILEAFETRTGLHVSASVR